MNRLFGAHSLWWDALLSLDVEGRDLVLPHLKDMPGVVDSPVADLALSEMWMGGDRMREGNCSWYVKKLIKYEKN